MDSAFVFLEELRRIAQLGLNYTQDHYDRTRYERLLELAAIEYEKLGGIPRDTLIERFHKQLGHVSPNIGVDAAIFDEQGRMLIIRRADDKLWGLPGGWAELGETAESSIEREVWEETGLTAKVRRIIHVSTRLPGQFGQPHTSYHLLFHCDVIEGTPSLSDETIDVGYFDPQNVGPWHRDHQGMANRAIAHWQTLR